MLLRGSVRKFIISNMANLHISLDVGKHEGAEEGSSRFESDYCMKISEEQNMLTGENGSSC